MAAQIKTNSEYHTTLARIEALIEKGPDNLNKKETGELAAIALAVEAFEREKYPMPLPTSIADYLQHYLLENDITQTELARLLAVSNSTINELLKGKKPVNMRLAKKLHSVLKLDGNFILEVA